MSRVGETEIETELQSALLLPVPAPFLALMRLAAAAYPTCLPYGGAHEDVVPHLTVGHDSADQPADPAELRAAAEAVRPLLPIAAEATEVILMTGPRPGRAPGPPGRWRTVAAFPLG